MKRELDMCRNLGLSLLSAQNSFSYPVKAQNVTEVFLTSIN